MHPFAPVFPNLIGVNNERSYAVSADSWDNFLFKVDQRIKEKDSFAVRVMQRWETSTNPFSGSTTGTFPSTTSTGQVLFGVSETHLFSPALINEFRAGVTRTTNDELSAFSGTNWAAKLGIPGTTNDPSFEGFPKFSITGFEGLGDSTSNPIHYVVNNWNVNDGITWIKGRHAIRIGGDLLRVQYYQPTNSNFNGTFTFNGKVTGDGIADFLLGFPSSTSRKIGTVTNHIFAVNYAGYVQDDFKILPSLTLNLGLRYELQMPPYEQAGQMTNFVPALDKVVLGGHGHRSQRGGDAGRRRADEFRRHGGQPRPAARAGVSRTTTTRAARWNGVASVRQQPHRHPQRLRHLLHRVPAQRDANRPDRRLPLFALAILHRIHHQPQSDARQSVSGFAGQALRDHDHQRMGSASAVALPAELELHHRARSGPRRGGRGQLRGSKGTHLGRKYDVNQEIRTPALDHPALTEATAISNTTSFGANSSYNAGTITVRKRIDNGLFFRANYTYGKSIDEQLRPELRGRRRLSGRAEFARI